MSVPASTVEVISCALLPIHRGMGPQLQHSDWLTGCVPDEVREQIRRLVEVLGYLPHLQPLGVVTADAVLLAANQPLLDLLGAGGAGGLELWAHVVATPVVTEGALGGERGVTDAAPALAAWTLFLSDCSPELPDGVEGRRREILELLLESPGEFVVKLDADGRMDFVSPSLCAALGRSAEALLGRPLDDDHSFAAAYRAQLAGMWEELARPPFGVQREMTLQTPDGELAVAWKFEALI